MKKVLSFLSILIAAPFVVFGQTANNLEVEMNTFFKQYVTNGLVDYQSIKKDPSQLNLLIEKVESQKIDALNQNQAKAFYINSYNLMVINAVVASYPIKSPMEVPGFFDQKKYKIANKELTLNDLENKVIRPTYNDARVHFALVCAAMGCPAIKSEAYNATELNHQLEEQTKSSMNDPNFIRINDSEKKVEISEIFKWYMDDFKKETKSIRAYINKYRTNATSKDYSLKYYIYDWNLNEKK